MARRSKLPKWAIKQAGGINKKAWALARKGRSSPKRRRASRPRKVKRMASRKMAVPHPSVTGMAAGFSLVDDLNKGNVVGMLMDGNFDNAIKSLTVNSQNLIKTDTGRKSLAQAVGIAAIGAWARRSLPGTKLGGTKFYFRI